MWGKTRDRAPILIKLTLIFVICSFQTLFGQVLLKITVTDESDRPLAGARITIKSGNNEPREAVSNKQGNVSLGLPSAGQHSLTASAESFFDLHKKLELNDGLNIIEIKMAKNEKVPYSITVTPGQEKINPEKSPLSSTLSEEFIRKIPILKSNDLKNILGSTPRFFRDPAGNLHFDGSPADQVYYALDGGNIADPNSGILETVIIVEAVKSADIYAGRYSVKYGKGSGGTLLLNSPTGDNKFKYGLTDFVPGIETRKGLAVSVWDPRFAFSGPLTNKIRFFNGLGATFTNNIVQELPKGHDRFHSWAGTDVLRLTANLAPNNILNASFLANYFNSPHAGLSALNPPETTVDRKKTIFFLTLDDQIVLNSKTIVDIRYGRYSSFIREIPQGHDLLRMYAYGSRGNSPVDSRLHGTRDQLLMSVIWPGLNFAGTHQFETGIDVNRSVYRQDITRTGFEHYRLDDSPVSRTTFGGNGKFSKSNLESAGYFLDRWNIAEGLFAEAGIRWDRDTIMARNAFSPRASISWVPAPLKNTKFTAGAGLIQVATTMRLFTRNLDQYSISRNFDRNGNETGKPNISIFAIDPKSLAVPKTTSFSFGVEQRLPGDFLVNANYLRKRSSNGYDFVLSLNPSGFTQFDPGKFDVYYFGLTNKKIELIDIFETSVTKKFFNRFDFMADFSKMKGWSNAATNIYIEDPIAYQDRTGPMPWEIPLRFMGFGTFEITKTHSAVYYTEWRDGLAFTLFNDDRLQVGCFNCSRYPRYFSQNIGYILNIPLWNRLWEIRLGIINVTNRPNYNLVNPNVSAPGFPQYYGAQPRRFDIRIRWGRS